MIFRSEVAFCSTKKRINVMPYVVGRLIMPLYLVGTAPAELPKMYSGYEYRRLRVWSLLTRINKLTTRLQAVAFRAPDNRSFWVTFAVPVVEVVAVTDNDDTAEVIDKARVLPFDDSA
jgi:hypothetical protein